MTIQAVSTTHSVSTLPYGMNAQEARGAEMSTESGVKVKATDSYAAILTPSGVHATVTKRGEIGMYDEHGTGMMSGKLQPGVNEIDAGDGHSLIVEWDGQHVTRVGMAEGDTMREITGFGDGDPNVDPAAANVSKPQVTTHLDLRLTVVEAKLNRALSDYLDMSEAGSDAAVVAKQKEIAQLAEQRVLIQVSHTAVEGNVKTDLQQLAELMKNTERSPFDDAKIFVLQQKIQIQVNNPTGAAPINPEVDKALTAAMADYLQAAFQSNGSSQQKNSLSIMQLKISSLVVMRDQPPGAPPPNPALQKELMGAVQEFLSLNEHTAGGKTDRDKNTLAVMQMKIRELAAELNRDIVAHR